jgi:hypothetical protein
MQRYWIGVLSAFILALAGGVASAQTKSQPAASAPSIPAASDPRSTSSAASSDDEDEDSADIPAIARGRINEQEYLRQRDQQAGMKRGVDDLARNPQGRSRAIRQMEAQEQTVRAARTAGARRLRPALSPPASPWTPLGPDPIPNGQTVGTEVAVSGRVTAIAIDPTVSNGNTVYVGTAQGGLYRSLDGGNTWVALMDSAQSLAIGALALDPTDPTVLFVGTGEGNFSVDSFFGVGLYIITNANSSFALNGPFNAPITTPLANPDGFTDVFSGRSITRILVNPANHSQILVSTSSGFSGASGDTFSNLPTRGVYLSTNVFSSGSTVGTPTFQRLTIQSGAGTANRPVTDMVMDPGNSNLVLVNVFGQSGTEGGIWVSSTSPTPWSGTATWTQTMQTALGVNGKFAANRSGTPTATTTFFAGLDQKAASGTCTGSEGTLFKAANNGGSSWTEITAARGFCGGQCFYDMPVAVDPTTTNNLYLGGQAGSSVGACGSATLGKSTNAGTSFAASEGLLHPDTHVIAIHPNGSILYTGNDGGIFRSNDGGTTWATLNGAGFTATQFESIAVHPTDPNFTIGGTQDNGTEMLKPDGSTWNRVDSGDGGFSAIDQNATNTTSVTMYHTYFNRANTLIGYAVVGTGVNTLENTWSFSGCQGTTPGSGINCTDTVLFYAPLVLGPGNPNTVYFGTDRLYRSTDQGNSHTVVSQAPIVANVPISAIGISPLSDLVRIVGLGNDKTNGTPNGHVFATTSGSSTLTDVTGPWTSKYIARAVIDPNNPNTAYITLDGYGAASGHVWETTNLSAASPTWTSMSSGIPDVPVNGFVVDAQNSNILYAATDIGVYNSVDGGNTWNPYGTGLPRVAVFDLKITAKRTVRIATHGRGMWETPAVSPGIATTLATSAPLAPPTNGVTLTVVVNHSSGTAVPTGSIAFLDSGLVLGSSTLNGSATATFPTGNLAPGSHTFFAAYGGDASYAASQSGFPVVIIVPSPDFALNINAPSVTVQRGQPANYPISIQPTAGFTGTVTFSCTSGLPAQASCSFSPSTVNVTSSGGATVLTIATTSPSAAPPAGGSTAGLGTTASVLGMGLGLALLGSLASRKGRRRPAFALLAFLALTVVLTSCGGGGSHNPGTPPGTSTITVTATSGGTTHTATVTLVVQ